MDDELIMDGWLMNERLMGGRQHIDGRNIKQVGGDIPPYLQLVTGGGYQTGWRRHTSISAVEYTGKEYQTGWRRHTTISAVGHRGKEYLPNKLEETFCSWLQGEGIPNRLEETYHHICSWVQVGGLRVGLVVTSFFVSVLKRKNYDVMKTQIVGEQLYHGSIILWNNHTTITSSSTKLW
jgi:hypothetical protein